jgi:hypothetical protein
MQSMQAFGAPPKDLVGALLPPGMEVSYLAPTLSLSFSFKCMWMTIWYDISQIVEC